MRQTGNDIKEFFIGIAKSDKNAFNTLFRLQYENLLRFAKHYVADTGQAEEIVSDVFVWLWLHRETLITVDKPEVYLFVTVRNRCLNALRHSSKIIPIDEQPVEVQQITYDNPLTEMEQKELSEKLNTIIENLPDQQKQIFKMIKENGLTARQTAEILQLSPRTVETHIYKAVRQLEEEITRYLGYSPKKKQMKRMISVLW